MSEMRSTHDVWADLTVEDADWQFLVSRAGEGALESLEDTIYARPDDLLGRIKSGDLRRHLDDAIGEQIFRVLNIGLLVGYSLAKTERPDDVAEWGRRALQHADLRTLADGSVL